MSEPKLKITSSDFEEGGWIPLKNTARGEDLSPQFNLSGISDKAATIAITMDDSSHPLFPDYNHWLIWNIPVMKDIPSGIPHGKTVKALGGASQGIAYGRYRYKGPKPPLKMIHNYLFTFYILDSRLDLPEGSRKNDLINGMKGHIIQTAAISGKFQSRRAEGSQDVVKN